jgi:hypothetical protein
MVERDRTPRRLLGQRSAEQFLVGALGAGPAQQLSRDRVAGVVPSQATPSSDSSGPCARSGTGARPVTVLAD